MRQFSEDRYLSAATLHRASAVLEGLAGVLDRVDGVFGDDAAADATHLRDLAATLAAWWPPPDGGGAADPAADPAARSSAWRDLLAIYVEYGFRPEGSTQADGVPVMSGEIEQKATLSRAELARWLADVARAIGEGGTVEVALAGPPVALELPERVRCELEIEPDGEEIELEIELTWPRPVR